MAIKLNRPPGARFELLALGLETYLCNLLTDGVHTQLK